MTDGTDRREFLAKTIRYISVGIAGLITGVFGMVLRSRIRERRLHFFPVLDEWELPRRGVRQVVLEVPSGGTTLRLRAFVVVNAQGDRYSLSARCTHLGCFVNWDKNRAEFVCPCHGGRYDLNGEVVGGPPPQPLERLPLEIRDGKAFVGYRV